MTITREQRVAEQRAYDAALDELRSKVEARTQDMGAGPMPDDGAGGATSFMSDALPTEIADFKARLARDRAAIYS